MKKFCALTAIAVALALGVPSGASAQQPAASPQPGQLGGATDPAVVYGWVDSCGRIIPYQTYSTSYAPVYTARYSYPIPCRPVYYTPPVSYYPSSCCYQPTYYYTPCGTSRRSYYRFCR